MNCFAQASALPETVRAVAPAVQLRCPTMPARTSRTMEFFSQRTRSRSRPQVSASLRTPMRLTVSRWIACCMAVQPSSRPIRNRCSRLLSWRANYDAEYGRNVGAHILTVTKSGTNQYHGSLFFQYDQPGLNAYQPFGGPTATPGVFAPSVRNDNAQREWAGSIGGPIIKNRLFLFASYEAAKSV